MVIIYCKFSLISGNLQDILHEILDKISGKRFLCIYPLLLLMSQNNIIPVVNSREGKCQRDSLHIAKNEKLLTVP